MSSDTTNDKHARTTAIASPSKASSSFHAHERDDDGQPHERRGPLVESSLSTSPNSNSGMSINAERKSTSAATVQNPASSTSTTTTTSRSNTPTEAESTAHPNQQHQQQPQPQHQQQQQQQPKLRPDIPLTFSDIPFVRDLIMANNAQRTPRKRLFVGVAVYSEAIRLALKARDAATAMACAKEALEKHNICPRPRESLAPILHSLLTNGNSSTGSGGGDNNSGSGQADSSSSSRSSTVTTATDGASVGESFFEYLLSRQGETVVQDESLMTMGLRVVASSSSSSSMSSQTSFNGTTTAGSGGSSGNRSGGSSDAPSRVRALLNRLPPSILKRRLLTAALTISLGWSSTYDSILMLHYVIDVAARAEVHWWDADLELMLRIVRRHYQEEKEEDKEKKQQQQQVLQSTALGSACSSIDKSSTSANGSTPDPSDEEEVNSGGSSSTPPLPAPAQVQLTLHDTVTRILSLMEDHAPVSGTAVIRHLRSLYSATSSVLTEGQLQARGGSSHTITDNSNNHNQNNASLSTMCDTVVDAATGQCTCCGTTLGGFTLNDADTAQLQNDIVERLVRPALYRRSHYDDAAGNNTTSANDSSGDGSASVSSTTEPTVEPTEAATTTTTTSSSNVAAVGEAEVAERWHAWEQFRDHAASLPYDALIDGANVGYNGLCAWYTPAKRAQLMHHGRSYNSIRADEITEMPFPVDVSPNLVTVNRVYQQARAMGLTPAIVLHARHVLPEHNRWRCFGSNREVLTKWQQQQQQHTRNTNNTANNNMMLLTSPAWMNDDYGWMYAAATRRNCVVITNDQMRDHHFELLSRRSFIRWRQRHRYTFTISRSATDITINVPRPFAVWAQRAAVAGTSNATMTAAAATTVTPAMLRAAKWSCNGRKHPSSDGGDDCITTADCKEGDKNNTASSSTSSPSSVWHIPYVRQDILNQHTDKATPEGWLDRDGDDQSDGWLCLGM